jgi:hypothetical protein
MRPSAEPALQFGHLREFTTFPDRQYINTTSGRSGLNHGWVDLPYLSTEAADYVKAVVEPQRIGKYPQITQITQIFCFSFFAHRRETE